MDKACDKRDLLSDMQQASLITFIEAQAHTKPLPRRRPRLPLYPRCARTIPLRSPHMCVEFLQWKFYVNEMCSGEDV